jgi:multidrug efflux system membrane fusion protein
MPQRPPSPVTVAVAQTRDVPVYLDEIGKTLASEVVNIQTQVGGQVMERHFQDGDELKTGQLLFVIDRRPFEAKVTEAEANLELSRTRLELAQTDYDRVMQASHTLAVSPEDRDTKKGVLDNAKAEVKVNQTLLDTAQLNLSYCTINSPIDGRAGQRMVDVGNVVKANDAVLLTIQKIAPIYADFTIVESDLPRVRMQMDKGALHTFVSLPQTPDETREGSLTFLDTMVQVGAGRINLRATLPNEDRYFWPGQFVKVRLVLSTIHDAVLAPYQCVQQGQQGMFVYVVKSDSTVEQRSIVLGQHHQSGNDDLIVIEKGVKAGERIVQTGQLVIGPGAKVSVSADSTAAASAAAQEGGTK